MLTADPCAYAKCAAPRKRELIVDSFDVHICIHTADIKRLCCLTHRMSSPTKGSNVAAVRRQNSLSRKHSSPKLIKKKSVSRYDETSKDSDSLAQSWTSRSYQDSPQSIQGSYPETSASLFIQQCIQNLPAELGTPVERCPLPEGSEDFKKVMHDISSETGQGSVDSSEGARHVVSKERSSSFRSQDTSSDALEGGIMANTNESKKTALMKKVSSPNLTGTAQSPVRRQGGQWSHLGVQRHASKGSEGRPAFRKTSRQEDIFVLSSDSEDDDGDKSRISPRRKPVSRQSSLQSSKSHKPGLARFMSQ